MTTARILLVEDESIIALEVKDRLESSGYTVTATASSGERAIEQAARTSPDLALMDIRLKGDIDGIETAEQIRAHFDIPVIYLTAYADETTLQRAKITEPYGYLIKPFEDRELHTTIEMALYKHKMERRLKESEQWLATTLRSIGDAIIAIDNNDLITFVNPVATTLTGWTFDDIYGKDWTQVLNIVNAETRSLIRNPIRRVLQESAIVGMDSDTLLISRDGVEIPIDYNAAPIRDDRHNVIGVILVFRDVSERKRAEREIARRLAQTQTLREVMLAAARTLDFDQVLEQTCRTLQERMQAEILNFALVDDSEGQRGLRLSTIGCPGPVQPVRLPLERSVCGQAFLTGEPIRIGDVHDISYYFETHPGVRSELAIPFKAGGKTIGVLNLQSRRRDAFGEEDLAFYTAIAGQLGIVLENARLYQELYRHADELAAALARLQELDRLKSEFMQNVSHELRTPLTLVSGFAGLLIEGDLGEVPAEQLRSIKSIARQSEKLCYMVEDITLVLRAESRALPHQTVAFDDLIRTSIEDFQLAAEQAKLTLCMEIASDIPPVDGAPAYLRRVIDNLLSNAIKFTPAGGKIDIHLRQQGDKVILEVTDTGIGIPADQQDRIFERFYQVDGSAQRRYGGMGLGLALVREIVDAYDGTVTVQSTVGGGSTFTVTLPVK